MEEDDDDVDKKLANKIIINHRGSNAHATLPINTVEKLSEPSSKKNFLIIRQRCHYTCQCANCKVTTNTTVKINKPKPLLRNSINGFFFWGGGGAGPSGRTV